MPLACRARVGGKLLSDVGRGGEFNDLESLSAISWSSQQCLQRKGTPEVSFTNVREINPALDKGLGQHVLLTQPEAVVIRCWQ